MASSSFRRTPNVSAMERCSIMVGLFGPEIDTFHWDWSGQAGIAQFIRTRLWPVENPPLPPSAFLVDFQTSFYCR